jgi:hypothetical protein
MYRTGSRTLQKWPRAMSPYSQPLQGSTTRLNVGSSKGGSRISREAKVSEIGGRAGAYGLSSSFFCSHNPICNAKLQCSSSGEHAKEPAVAMTTPKPGSAHCVFATKTISSAHSPLVISLFSTSQITTTSNIRLHTNPCLQSGQIQEKCRQRLSLRYKRDGGRLTMVTDVSAPSAEYEQDSRIPPL